MILQKLVNFGDAENVIAVRIDNNWDYRERATKQKYQWEDKNFNANYGGITKNVFLHVTPNVYQTLPLYSNLKTTGVYIYADNYNIKANSANIHAEGEVKNETNEPQFVTYQAEIINPDGITLKMFIGDKVKILPGETKIIKAASPVKDLKFWSWGYGYLYKVKTSLIINEKALML